MRRSITRLISVISITLLPFSSAGAQDEYVIRRLDGPVQLDGISNEPAWQAIEPLPLVMQQPTYGVPPSERTEIRIGYDEEFLYLAGNMYDDPSGVQGPSLKRDELNNFNDYFGIILDSFNDNENALCFFTTPAGVRVDFTIFNDAQAPTPDAMPINDSWDTFWDVAVITNDEGGGG